MHVGDEDVELAIVVEVEHLDAHRSPRRLWKQRAALLDEPLAALVLVVLVVAEHVQDVEIGPAVVVGIDNRRVARPRRIDQSHLLRHINEVILADVVVEDLRLRAFRFEVA